MTVFPLTLTEDEYPVTADAVGLIVVPFATFTVPPSERAVPAMVICAESTPESVP